MENDGKLQRQYRILMENDSNRRISENNSTSGIYEDELEEHDIIQSEADMLRHVELMMSSNSRDSSRCQEHVIMRLREKSEKNASSTKGTILQYFDVRKKVDKIDTVAKCDNSDNVECSAQNSHLKRLSNGCKKIGKGFRCHESSTHHESQSSFDIFNTSCVICSEQLKNKSSLGKTDGCKHIFCSECILKWVLISSYCPLCKCLIKNLKKLYKEYNYSEERAVDVPVVWKKMRHEDSEFGDDGNHSCMECQNDDNWESLLLCDNCDNPYHLYCLNPPLSAVPVGSWFCRDCESILCTQANDLRRLIEHFCESALLSKEKNFTDQRIQNELTAHDTAKKNHLNNLRKSVAIVETGVTEKFKRFKTSSDLKPSTNSPIYDSPNVVHIGDKESVENGTVPFSFSPCNPPSPPRPPFRRSIGSDDVIEIMDDEDAASSDTNFCRNRMLYRMKYRNCGSTYDGHSESDDDIPIVKHLSKRDIKSSRDSLTFRGYIYNSSESSRGSEGRAFSSVIDAAHVSESTSSATDFSRFRHEIYDDNGIVPPLEERMKLKDRKYRRCE